MSVDRKTRNRRRANFRRDRLRRRDNPEPPPETETEDWQLMCQTVEPPAPTKMIDARKTPYSKKSRARPTRRL